MKTKDAYNKLKKRQTWLFILLFLWIGIVFLLSPAQAQTISMTNPQGVGERDIQVFYAVNGTLYGSYNTTSIITLDQNQSYVFMLKPQSANPLNDPGAFLTDILTFAQTNVIPLVIIIFLIALFLGRR
jgi:hypothetical protein